MNKTPFPSEVELSGDSQSNSWTFLTNHGHVLICLSENPDIRLRDVAQLIGITERAVHNIVSDLETAGIIQRHREGRRNHYTVNGERPLRHTIESHCTVKQLVDFVSSRRKS